MAKIKSPEQAPKKEIHLDIVKKRLDELAKEQKAKLGERTISDEDITRFGDNEISDSDKFEILKRTKTPMDIFTLMIENDRVRSGKDYIKGIILKLKDNEEDINLLLNIIQAHSIKGGTEFYEKIVKAIRDKFDHKKIQKTDEIEECLMNKPKEISNKAIKQNNIAELYSKIYIEILKSEISYFLGRLENNFTDRDIPSEIIDLLRDMERYIILRQKTWPKIKEYFCYLIEIKEAAEQRRLEERQIDDKYGFLYADIQEYIQNSQRLKEKAKRKIELRKNIIKNL